MPRRKGDNVENLEEARKGKEVRPEFKKIDQTFLNRLADARARLNQLSLDSKKINDERSSIYSGMQSDGLNANAVKMAIRYVDMTDEQKTNFDLSYAVARRAFGEPLQDDLFVAAANAQLKASQN